MGRLVSAGFVVTMAVAVCFRGTPLVAQTGKATEVPERKRIELTEPGVYTDSDCLYVMTKDITSKGAGFTFDGKNYVVDLGGHTLTFNNEPYEAEPGARYIYQAPWGIALRGEGAELRNGTIVQGAGHDRRAACVLVRARKLEIHHVTTVITGGWDANGYYGLWGPSGLKLHHNYIVCLNDGIHARGIHLQEGGTDSDIHHNTIVGGHFGISVGGRGGKQTNAHIHHNYIQHRRTPGQKSPQAIVTSVSSCEIDHNQICSIDGRGLLPIRPDSYWHDNIVDVRYTSKAQGGFYPENRCYGFWERDQNTNGNRIENNLFVVNNEIVGDPTSNTTGLLLCTNGGPVERLAKSTVTGNRILIRHDDKARPARGFTLQNVGDEVIIRDNLIWAETLGVLVDDRTKGPRIEGNTFVKASPDWRMKVTWEGGTGEGLKSCAFRNNKVVDPPKDNVPPVGPTGLTVTRRINGYELHWEPNPEADVPGYYVYRDGKRVEERLKCGRFYVDTTADPKLAYTYAVSAVDLSGNEGPKCGPAAVTRGAAAQPATKPPVQEQAGPATVKIGELEFPADCPLVKNERPRLLFCGRDLPKYKERIAGPMKADFERFKAYWDRKIAQKDYDWKRDAALDGVALGVLYQLTGERRYADVVRNTTVFKNGGGVRAWAPAFALDLIFDTLSEEEVAEQVELLLAKGWHWGGGFAASGRLWQAIVLYGGGSGRDEEIARELTTGVRAARVKLAEANEWAGNRGGDSTSFSYLPSHTVNLVCPHVFAFNNALGMDMWKESTWMRNLNSYFVYHFYPWDHVAVHFDYTCGRFMGPPSPGQDWGASFLLPAASARYRDGLYKWWTHRLYVHQDPALTGWGKTVREARVMGGLWCRILFCDPDVPMLGPENFPPSRFFPTRGLACMRESWDKDATFVHFACGAWCCMGDPVRRNADNNQFTIYKKGILALDTGGQHVMDVTAYRFDPAGNHILRYASQTIAHNGILVHHPADDDFWKKYGKCNTGGQAKWPAEWREKRGMAGRKAPQFSWAGPPRPTGKTLAWETSYDYDYVCGDATNSYSPTTVDSFTRQLVYVRPDLIFVYDRVETARDGCRTTWLLHTADKPKVHGHERPDVRIHPKGHFLWEGSTATVTDEQMGGRMFCRMLLPEKREVRVLGGENHEFELPDGSNPGPTPETYKLPEETLRAARSVGFGLRGWRIEIEDKTGGRSVRFLNVFQTCDRDTPQMAPCERVQRSGMVGARVTVAGKVVEVLFRTSGKVGGHITVESNRRKLVDRALATNIEDNYERWKQHPDYEKWMTDPYRCSVVLGRNP